MSEEKPARVAIKFGGASASQASKGRPTPPSSLGKRHRAGRIPEHSDSEHESGGEGRHEKITAYGPTGARNDDNRRSRRERSSSYERKRRRPRSRSRDRGYGKRRDEPRDSRNGHSVRAGKIDDESPQPIQYGLTINNKSNRSQDARGQESSRSGRQQSAEKADSGPEADTKPMTADEEALEALMGNEPKRPNRSQNGLENDYQSMPIEDFGASLLRNLGWNGKMKGTIVEPRKRGNLTGLGSKNAKEAEDLGAWEQKKPKSRRLDDYQREEDARRKRREGRHGESSYKRERERDRDRERDRYRH